MGNEHLHVDTSELRRTSGALSTALEDIQHRAARADTTFGAAPRAFIGQSHAAAAALLHTWQDRTTALTNSVSATVNTLNQNAADYDAVEAANVHHLYSATALLDFPAAQPAPTADGGSLKW
ncbi:MAG: hypothetical protein ACRCSF_13105 [Mycobacteriaceae bacterium]